MKGKLPLCLKSISLGRLFIRIPWLHLSSEPLSIILEDVYVLANPKQIHKLSYDAEQEIKKAARKALLAQLDKTTTLESSGTIFASATANFGFLRALILKCVDNVQFEINRLHVVYQDDGHSPGVNFHYLFIYLFIFLYF
jgi:vacuolar protein sorting-associated protein 13A/C